MNQPRSLQLSKRRHILIVEDSAINRSLAHHMFKEAGYEVDTAEDGFQAVKLCRDKRYDLILMDCRLPGLAGFSAARMIRQLERERRIIQGVPIIGLTAFPPPEYRRRCRLAGMDDCYIKPLKNDIIARIIAQWLPDPPHTHRPLAKAS